MTRQEGIQKIVWALLAYAETPREAVVAAATLKPCLGERAEQNFRNLLRAAGLFACDDDAFYVRYVLNTRSQDEPKGLLAIPPATHLLTVPVPVEPRMRIAYSVFAGLLLKHLYQRYDAVPLQVAEGMATLSNLRPLADAKPLLVADTHAVWLSFRASDLARTALEDGIGATFSALRRGRRIGAIELPAAWKGSEIETVLRKSVAKHPKLFQTQSKAEKLQFKIETKTMKSPSMPFSLIALDSAAKQDGIANTVGTGPACLVCGQHGDLIQGGKFFLPENKKQWYEQPGPRDKFPNLCANCAYISLLSGIVPSDDMSIAEIPTDNFLELFALHENLHGISGAVALKVINRVATLSVLPSRYLLLSKSSKPGQMDSKTQVYIQLLKHESLLRCLDRPMRVQVEGNQPNFWSDIHPHVAIGLSYFAHLPSYYETGDRKILAQRTTRVLAEGRPFAALYLATQARQPEQGFGFERDILTRGVRIFERDFIKNTQYAAKMALALGGPNMDCNFYNDVIDFSNYLLDLTRPLVDREVRESKSAVSGVARKYTELIARDFVECRAAKFLYVVCQEADAAERDGDGWAKWQSLTKLYGSTPDTRGRSSEEQARLWSEFREQHARTALEARIAALQEKHGKDTGLWSKFLNEVQARTLALLMLNVRNVTTQ